MTEYIEREALLNRLKTKVKRITPIEESRDMFYHDSGVNAALTIAMLEVGKAPAADVVPVIHAKWETEPEDVACGNFIKRKFCTNCRKRPSFDKDKFEFILPPRCPNCGARMDGE